MNFKIGQERSAFTACLSRVLCQL